MSSPIPRRPLLFRPDRRPPGKRRTAYEHFPPYDLYPIRSIGIRSLSIAIFSLTNIRPHELFRMLFISYDILAHDLHPVRPFSFTNICHYERNTVRTLPHTIFRQKNFFLRAFGIRTLSIRSLVRTPLAPPSGPSPN